MISSFNPRTHTGCDYYPAFLVAPLIVSIHAPTRGATWQTPSCADVRLFQSTHPHGVRLCRPYFFIKSSVLFQSTHPHGVRQRCFGSGLQIFLFQSTHPHGVRRVFAEDDGGNIGVSIHAPTRGATTNNVTDEAGKMGFNPRTHTGCDVKP